MTRVFLVHPVRLYRDLMAAALERTGRFEVIGSAATPSDALGRSPTRARDVALVDASTEVGRTDITSFRRACPEIKVVALAVVEEEKALVSLARAGVAGYAAPESTLDEVIDAVVGATQGELRCPPRLAGMLLRGLAADRAMPPASSSGNGLLTARETQVLELIENGLSNKEIAVELCVEVSTVKNHVHSVLHKLRVKRRAQAAALLRSGITHDG